MIVIKSAQEIERMRIAGQMVGEILELLKEKVTPGITTAELDELAERECHKRKAKPAFKGYRGYPATLCVSVNEQVVHGIPGAAKLAEVKILR